MPRILIIGADGQVGWELQRSMASLGEVVTAGPHQANYLLDLADKNSIETLLRQLQPQLIVNAAAYTAVDQAESDSELAWAVNAEALTVIGAEAKKLNCPVVHYSTDYVFSGEHAGTPWTEEDAVDPQSVYGSSKLAGEQQLLASGAQAIVLRTCWVYGPRGKNFLLTMLRLFREKSSLGIVADQFGIPTGSRLIADLTAQIVAQCQTEAGFEFGKKAGLYHLSAAGQASWHDFASEILRLSGESCDLKPLTTAEYPTPAERPAWSVLNTQKLADQFGLMPPDWRILLSQCMADMGLPE